jgi:hypothetical protein
MPRAEEPVFDELPEHLVLERKHLETFHKNTVEEPFHEFLVTFPLQSTYLTGIESLEIALERHLDLSDNKKNPWSKAPRTKFSYTTLHEVVRSGDLKTLQTLAEKFLVDLNCQSRSGRTALHYAILTGHDEMVGYLLSRNVDVSIVDKVGCNALHIAVAQNRESLAKVLLSLGLDFSQKNHAGHRPLEIMALNVLGYKNTNLFKHLIKLIIKRQTGIVEKWLNDLYSCGIFEMMMSPRELTGSQLLDLQSENSALFSQKWTSLQLVMDPEFKSTGRTTLPGQGFRDDRPSSLANGRFLELWSKYYDSLKLGCKPAVTCKFSKKTEPDQVHLKYVITGVRKGRYDPEFIDTGLMIVNLKNDLILKEEVDPDIAVEQPEIVKPKSSGLEKPKKQTKMHRRGQHSEENESADNSDTDDLLSDVCIIVQEIQSMLEIIQVVHEMESSVESMQVEYFNTAEFNAVVAADINYIFTTNMVPNSKTLKQPNEMPVLLVESGNFFSNLSTSLAVAAVLDSIIIDIERNLKAVRQPTPTTLESILQDFESEGIRGNAARFSNEGKIINSESEKQTEKPKLLDDSGNFFSNLSTSLAVAAVLDSIIIDIERNLKAVRQPTPTTLESILQDFESEGIRRNAARFLHEGPIIDLRSLPWEAQLGATHRSYPMPSKTQRASAELALRERYDLMRQPINVASSANENSVQNALSDRAFGIPKLKLTEYNAKIDQSVL